MATQKATDIIATLNGLGGYAHFHAMTDDEIEWLWPTWRLWIALDGDDSTAILFGVVDHTALNTVAEANLALDLLVSKALIAGDRGVIAYQPGGGLVPKYGRDVARYTAILARRQTKAA